MTERCKLARELYPSPFDTGSPTLDAINRHTMAILVSLPPAPHRFGYRPSVDAYIDAALLAELDRNARAVCRDLLPSLYDDVDEPFMGAAATVIKGHCVTNLDDFKLCEWPTQFAFPPRVGDSVMSGDRNPYRRKLKVVQVTHLFDGTIEVELHR